jgi:FemAB-related protein (PEP-CTERM system-associated)
MSSADSRPALAPAERKRLLRDPAAWVRQQGLPVDERLEQLITAREPMRGELREVTEASRALSREIGEAKKAGADTAALLQRKREQSASERQLQERLDELERELVAHCCRVPRADRLAQQPETLTEPETALGEISVEPFTADDAAAWDRFVTTCTAASVYHLCGWRDVITTAFGHPCHYQLARAGGEIVGVLPLVQLNSRLFGNFLVSVPFFNYGGVLTTSARARRALLERATALGRELGCTHLELRDREPMAEWPARTDKVAMWLPLPDSADLLWQQIGSKVRAQVKKAQGFGLTFRIGGEELLDDFYRVFTANMRDLGTPVYSRRFFEVILRRGPGQPVILVGYDPRGRAVSTAFLLQFAGRMEVPWASTLRAANTMNANMALYWRILEHACEQRCHTFDFGRSTADAPTYRFKKQWGAQPVQLHWHYWLADGGELPRLNPDNPKYRAAIAIWQRLPVWLTKLIGPPVVKNLP